MTAVITGIGVAAPTGVGAKAHWAALLDGRSGLARVAAYDAAGYPTRVAGEVAGFDPAQHAPRSLRAQTDHMTHLALAAAAEALADADVDPATVPEYEMGVVLSNSSGGIEFAQRELQRLWSQGPMYVGAYMSVAWFYAASAGQLSIRHGLRGPCVVVSAEQAGGLDAIGHARRQVRRGTPLLFTGGTDAAACPMGITFQLTTGTMSRRDDVELAYRPFDRDANGWVPGHGGAVLVLEDGARAAARGARRYAEVTGYAATFDPPAGTAEPALRRTIEMALRDADAGPDEVDVVFADAAGVPDADRAETDALRAVFGARGVPVTAPKSMTGRLGAGAGPLDVATAVLALRDGLIPPTVNVADPASGDLDLVRDGPRRAELRTALVLARGHGGFNAAVVLRA